MTTDVSYSLDGLIAQLDPNRNYGELGYEGVCAGIRSGSLMIFPPPQGSTQPLLSDSRGVRIKGSGAPYKPGNHQGVIEWSRSRFQERAAEDFDLAYDALISACGKEEPRALKIFFEMLIGQPRQQGISGSSELVKELIDRLSQPRETVIEVVARD